MESIRCDKSTTGLDEKESTPPSPNSSCLHQQQSANAVVASFKQGLPPIKECPVVESMQYAFGPDGTLTTGPILRTDPQTGLIIYSTCWNQKPDTAFQVTGPHRFMNPMCSDCQSAYEVKPPACSLGKRRPQSEEMSGSVKRTKPETSSDVD